jgi:hypothetical protein
MNAITDIWRQLVRRRLWPVAILLVAGLAAVPMLLAKEPEPAPPAPPVSSTPVDAKASLADEPIVTLASEDAAKDRSPLGKRHDIFKPTKKTPKAKKAQEDAPDDSGSVDTPAEKPSGDSPSVPDSGPVDGGTTPEADKPAPKTYPLYSLKLRFTVADESVTGYLPRGTALPSREEPLIIYLGLLDDHKTAVFMLDSTLQAVGDGECHPTPENCETVRMQVGDTMFFDQVDENGNVVGAQFQLDLLKINKKQTTDAAKAAKSAKLAKVSAASRVGGVAAGLGGDSLRRLGVIRNG